MFNPHKPHPLRAFLVRHGRVFLPIASTAFFYALYYAVCALRFDIAIAPGIIRYDFTLNLILGYALIALSKRVWVFLLLQGLLMGLMYVGNAIKISFFGGPILPDDLYALRALLLILEGWKFYLAALPLAAIASLLVFNFSLRHWGSYLALAGLVLFGVTLVYQPRNILHPLDYQFGTSVWDQRSNYLYRGAALYSLQEGARYFADRELPPERDAARAAQARLLAAQAVRNPVAPFKPRNVHVILLESFWDPAPLKAAHFPHDPLPADFRRLWSESGESRILSPVFGGYTANAEFEMLCGFPVVKDAVRFERDLKNDVPCLPHILAQQGYATFASHPNVPVFWNRINAYRRLGFQTFWSLKDFEQTDMVREFMSDASLYRQVLAKLEPQLASDRPVFNYIVTYYGHWDYPLRGNRPRAISDRSQVPEVGSYANQMHYKARELMDFLKQLRARDPESLIVVFGDHLPFLGENFAGFVESGLLTDNRSAFNAEMFQRYTATPLVVIDGTRGAQRLGTLPLYELPARLLGLLGMDEHTLFDTTRPPAGLHVRPLPGMHYLVDADGGIELCRQPPFKGHCARSAAWLADVITVGNDLFIGQQHTRSQANN
jgi:phosphoglycerol transferase MdoB-like AlkP superfamily enzyme